MTSQGCSQAHPVLRPSLSLDAPTTLDNCLCLGLSPEELHTSATSPARDIQNKHQEGRSYGGKGVWVFPDRTGTGAGREQGLMRTGLELPQNWLSSNQIARNQSKAEDNKVPAYSADELVSYRERWKPKAATGSQSKHFPTHTMWEWPPGDHPWVLW